MYIDITERFNIRDILFSQSSKNSRISKLLYLMKKCLFTVTDRAGNLTHFIFAAKINTPKIFDPPHQNIAKINIPLSKYVKNL